NTGSVNFTESQKAPVQAQFIRQGEISNLLRVKMKNGATNDEIAIRLLDEATESFDSKYDGYKFQPTGLNLSSLTKENDRLAINAISRSSCNGIIPLDIDGAVLGNYTFDLTGLETFDADLKLFLHDKGADKRLELASTPTYTFSVSDVSTLKNRFEIVLERPTVELGIPVAGESICEGNTATFVTLENTQAHVKYSASWNGTTISAEVEGNGGKLTIPINVDVFPQGENEINILAKMLSCEPLLLTNKAKLTIVKKGLINSVEDGASCSEGTVNLRAIGSDATLYNWYETEGDASPIADQHANEFTTPVLSKSKTYYVAAVNSLGCESERVPVKATITNLDLPSITAVGNTLSSSFPDGNQWYVDGLIIENATSQTLEVTASGVYTVVATKDHCSVTSEGREMVVTGIAEFQSKYIHVYPNPTTEKVTIEVRSTDPAIEARLIHASGKELGSIILTGSDDIKSGEFTMTSLPDGVYLIRINEGHHVFTKKISKIK
ncbi:MAG TPA: T9SS type A sorting domain-containing protein, partial [Chryseolinea sp.]|nr:T9SS type A sorting domain-containing protein [Chryseolinea sp.]